MESIQLANTLIQRHNKVSVHPLSLFMFTFYNESEKRKNSFFFSFRIAVIAEASVPFDRLKAICAQMTKATQDFRKYLGEAKELHARQIERMQRERDAALMAARVHADIDDPNNIHSMPGVEIATTKKVCAIFWHFVFPKYAFLAVLHFRRIQINDFFFVNFSAQIVIAKH